MSYANLRGDLKMLAEACNQAGQSAGHVVPVVGHSFYQLAVNIEQLAMRLDFEHDVGILDGTSPACRAVNAMLRVENKKPLNFAYHRFAGYVGEGLTPVYANESRGAEILRPYLESMYQWVKDGNEFDFWTSTDLSYDAENCQLRFVRNTANGALTEQFTVFLGRRWDRVDGCLFANFEGGDVLDIQQIPVEWIIMTVFMPIFRHNDIPMLEPVSEEEVVKLFELARLKDVHVPLSSIGYPEESPDASPALEIMYFKGSRNTKVITRDGCEVYFRHEVRPKDSVDWSHLSYKSQNEVFNYIKKYVHDYMEIQPNVE